MLPPWSSTQIWNHHFFVIPFSWLVDHGCFNHLLFDGFFGFRSNWHQTLVKDSPPRLTYVCHRVVIFRTSGSKEWLVNWKQINTNVSGSGRVLCMWSFFCTQYGAWQGPYPPMAPISRLLQLRQPWLDLALDTGVVSRCLLQACRKWTLNVESRKMYRRVSLPERQWLYHSFTWRIPYHILGQWMALRYWNSELLCGLNPSLLNNRYSIRRTTLVLFTSTHLYEMDFIHSFVIITVISHYIYFLSPGCCYRPCCGWCRRRHHRRF